MGAVRLGVADLSRSLDFYDRAIGLERVDVQPGLARLGVDGKVLLELVEVPGARPSRRHTGLFHFALLLPERADLARWLARAFDRRLSLTGAADHFVSEAIYLDDPDGHGIEIYWDRPRAHWEGRVAQRMTTLPLDLRGLLDGLDGAPAAPEAGLPSGTTMGHVHLRVAAIGETLAFYGDLLGFELMARLGDQAAFLAAGGYHHHLGANTWQSRGAGPPPEGFASLQHVSLLLPDEDERARLLQRLRRAGLEPRASDEGPTIDDPSGNRLRLALA